MLTATEVRDDAAAAEATSRAGAAADREEAETAARGVPLRTPSSAERTQVAQAASRAAAAIMDAAPEDEEEETEQQGARSTAEEVPARTPQGGARTGTAAERQPTGITSDIRNRVLPQTGTSEGVTDSEYCYLGRRVFVEQLMEKMASASEAGAALFVGN